LKKTTIVLLALASWNLGGCVAVGLTALAVQGARYARVERLGPAGTAAVVAANLALGGIIVVFKVIVSH